jgi:predicted anti-sigma-YlaC factor YlaD
MTQVLDDITCRELVELVTDYLEGALSDADRTRFDEHLEICEACRTYINQMRRTIEVSGRLTEEALEPSARDALIDAFRDWNRSRPNPRP